MAARTGTAATRETASALRAAKDASALWTGKGGREKIDDRPAHEEAQERDLTCAVAVRDSRASPRAT